MKQLPLPHMPEPTKIVNVASVPHRSPFRYPGGKTWLVPTIRRWLGHLQAKPAHFVEPFAGGGIVGLTVAFEQLAEHVTLVELDEQVAAVWDAIITHDEALWLGEQIVSFELTRDNVERLLAQNDGDNRLRALQTIVKNRVNRGGILAAGAGMLKEGDSGRGIASRWYPQTLRNRILHIAQIRHRLSFIHGDGIEVIRQHADDPHMAFFIDAPYTASGSKPGTRLYDHSEIDHNALFELMATISGDFVMTYNNTQHILAIAQHHGLDTEIIAMKNTHHAKKTELLIGKTLDWLR